MNGYSEEFVNNMKNVINELEQNSQVQLVTECDVICKSCPRKNIENECKTFEMVQNHDNKVLEYLSLKPNSILNWNDFKEIAKSKILDNNQLQEVCHECSWLELCCDINSKS